MRHIVEAEKKKVCATDQQKCDLTAECVKISSLCEVAECNQMRNTKKRDEEEKRTQDIGKWIMMIKYISQALTLGERLE